MGPMSWCHVMASVVWGRANVGSNGTKTMTSCHGQFGLVWMASCETNVVPSKPRVVSQGGIVMVSCGAIVVSDGDTVGRLGSWCHVGPA